MSTLGSIFGSGAQKMSNLTNPATVPQNIYNSSNNSFAMQAIAKNAAAQQNNSVFTGGLGPGFGVVYNRAALEHPMYSITVACLKDIWWAKHGTQWVSMDVPEGDIEQRLIFQRLKKMLEEVYLQDKGHPVYRLPQE